LWNVAPDSIRLEGKGVVSGDKRMSLAEVAGLSQRMGGGLISHGTSIQPMPVFDPGRVKHHPLPAWTSHSFHAHAVDLSIDDVTGEVSINRYVVAQDVGFAIKPNLHRGPDRGRCRAGHRPGAERGDRVRGRPRV